MKTIVFCFNFLLWGPPSHLNNLNIVNFSSDNKPHERAASRQRMEQTYSNMMSTYARQQENLANQPKWVHPKTKGSEMPHPCTLTHVNQTQDLMVSSLIICCVSVEQWLM